MAKNGKPTEMVTVLIDADMKEWLLKSANAIGKKESEFIGIILSEEKELQKAALEIEKGVMKEEGLRQGKPLENTKFYIEEKDVTDSISQQEKDHLANIIADSVEQKNEDFMGKISRIRKEQHQRRISIEKCLNPIE